MVEKNMVTLTERTIMKSRSGVYSDTAENRRKHRVGQKYGAEKQSDDGEKTEKKETDPAKELEAVNKVIAAINEGKLNLPAAEVMKLSEKKQKLEAAKNQAEKINAGVKANEEKKNAEEAKETSKKINEAQKKESEQKESVYEKADRVLKEAPIGAEASGGGYGPFKKEKVGVWINKVTGRKFNGSLAEHIGGFSDFAIKKKLKEEVDNLQRRKELSEKVERLISEKKKKFPNPDIESPMSDEEKRLTKEIADTWSEINKLIQENRKSKEESKSEPQKERVSLSGWEGNSFSDTKKYGEDGVVESMAVQAVPNLKDKKYEYSASVSASKVSFEAAEEFHKEAEDLKSKLFSSPNEAAKAADKFANKWNSKDSKSESKQGETEESYTRVKFEDVPNSGKVNLKKYLSEKVRKGVDEKWSNIKNIPTENLKKMEKGLVNDLNKNFEAIKKSQRAELLYSIMKVKGELESRGKETQKKE